MTPVRNDTVTIPCGVCGSQFTRTGRAKFCSDACRQAAFRRRRQAPMMPTVKPSTVVYECAHCGTRYLGQQRCDDCNRWCTRIGPGGTCPHCDEPVAITDLLTEAEFALKPLPSRTGKQPT